MSGDHVASRIPARTDAGDLADLTRRLVRGEEAAYREFHAAYFDRLFRYLLVVTRGDEHGAREALQGTMMRVVRHIRVFEDETVFWSWLTVLARSASADESRKRRRYFAFLERFRFQAEVEVGGAENVEAEAKLEHVLAECTASLEEEERMLIGWKYSERVPVREIAARLGATEKTVESRLTRVRQRLKAAMLEKLKNEKP